MHEYHIVEGIVKQVIEKAKTNNASRVTKIKLAVGELSGLEESSIKLYFDDLSKSTMIEDADLIINTVYVQLKCKKCNKMFELKGKNFNCPDCGNLGTATDIGKELYIEDIEVETV